MPVPPLIPACPICHAPIVWEPACRTDNTGTPDTPRWTAHRDCTTAIRYRCVAYSRYLPGYSPLECTWRYLHGMSAGNPDATVNAAARPDWLTTDMPDRSSTGALPHPWVPAHTDRIDTDRAAVLAYLTRMIKPDHLADVLARRSDLFDGYTFNEAITANPTRALALVTRAFDCSTTA
jgi:hypothetical protein